MMLRSKLAIYLSTLIIAGSAFSAEEMTCPDINDIKAERLIMADSFWPGEYSAANHSSYNTDSQWVFLIYPVKAESKDEALLLGNEILNTVTGPATLESLPNPGGPKNACFYNTNNSELSAFAMKNDVSSVKLKQLLKAVH